MILLVICNVTRLDGEHGQMNYLAAAVDVSSLYIRHFTTKRSIARPLIEMDHFRPTNQLFDNKLLSIQNTE